MPLWLYLSVLAILCVLGFTIQSTVLWAIARLFRVRLSFGRAFAILGAATLLSLASIAATLAEQLALSAILALPIPVLMVILIHRWARGRAADLARPGWWRSIFVSVSSLVAGYALALAELPILWNTIARAWVPTTSSMAPTISVGDRFLADPLLTPRRWDIVVYTSTRGDGQVYIKRIIGLPGETVELIRGRVHINGAAPTPPAELADLVYESRPNPHYGPLQGVSADEGGKGPITLGPNEFFVLGDNSPQSEDSRHTPAIPGYQPGTVPRSHLRAVVRIVYYPWSRMRTFR